jgi:hypothetical protein
MKKNDGDTRVTPDLRKGKLTVRADQDQLMHFIWTNREQGASCARGLAPLSAPARPQSPGAAPWAGALRRVSTGSPAWHWRKPR